MGEEIPTIISFDMDGTLVDAEFTDWVWGHGIPTLYAKKAGLSFEAAKDFVVKEYLKVGEGAMEWYDIKYWFQLFQLEESWEVLMERYTDKIKIYPDVHPLLERLRDRHRMVLTSNAGREFIGMEMEATSLGQYFDRIFSATSDFGEVKKTAAFYQRICQILEARPQEIVHVGDHYEFDYLVPRSLGIQAFYLDRSGRGGGDFTLSDLRDLEKRLPAALDQRRRIEAPEI
ncbi:MAG TPA: HAD family hydrolase [Thermodesulfobacteriota bacterium]|nr:HAD family hydrolase [Thermodesulfobacteriota bacterium]